jgi:probable F420-dependent oxidoreductase
MAQSMEEASMKYNLMFPMRAVEQWTHWSKGADLGEMARLVEDAGFAGFSMAEHPYPDKHWLARRGNHHAFDPFVSLSFAAAATTRIQVITYVMVSGYRNPYLSAKAAASLDTLSRGRLTVGTSAGYLKSEFDALGADFDRRGALLDEALQAWKAIWAGRPHTGPAFGAPDHVALPLPLTPGGPPVWIGGNREDTRRQVVELADGWIPLGSSPEMAAIPGTEPFDSVESLAAGVAALNNRRAELGRERADVAFAPFENAMLARGEACDVFCAAVKSRLDDYAEAGVTWLTIEPKSRNIGDFRADVDMLAAKLIAAQ